MSDKHKTYAFAVEWLNKFQNPNINYLEIVDGTMGDECSDLGFEMDCGNAFSEKYGQAVNDCDALEKIIDVVDDVNLLGSAIFSQWRYFNHWAYSGTEVLEPNNRKWFVLALNRLGFEALFEQWKEKYEFKAFIRDGIVDVLKYEKPHVLFVLRDMNKDTEGDLRSDLKECGSGWRTWNNVGRWTKALLDGDEEYPRDMRKDKRIEQLCRIAAINLKKDGGGSRTNGEELKHAVETYKEMTYEEILLCEPDIIIACGLPAVGIEGNAVLLRAVLPVCGDEYKISSTGLPREWSYYFANIGGKNVPVIGFCHPQATCLDKKRGHELFKILYRDMLTVREKFLK